MDEIEFTEDLTIYYGNILPFMIKDQDCQGADKIHANVNDIIPLVELLIKNEEPLLMINQFAMLVDAIVDRF